MADVEMVIDAIRQSSVSGQWVVVLREKTAEQYLPIWIGSSQAETIKRELTDVSPSRPLDSEVKEVKIYKFEDNRFSAKLVSAVPGKPCEVDCPPATALAIAVRARVPVFTDEVILNKAGISLPAWEKLIKRSVNSKVAKVLYLLKRTHRSGIS